jgi:hypothetical protein
MWLLDFWREYMQLQSCAVQQMQLWYAWYSWFWSPSIPRLFDFRALGGTQYVGVVLRKYMLQLSGSLRALAELELSICSATAQMDRIVET